MVELLWCVERASSATSQQQQQQMPPNSRKDDKHEYCAAAAAALLTGLCCSSSCCVLACIRVERGSHIILVQYHDHLLVEFESLQITTFSSIICVSDQQEKTKVSRQWVLPAVVAGKIVLFYGTKISSQHLNNNKLG